MVAVLNELKLNFIAEFFLHPPSILIINYGVSGYELRASSIATILHARHPNWPHIPVALNQNSLIFIVRDMGNVVHLKGIQIYFKVYVLPGSGLLMN